MQNAIKLMLKDIDGHILNNPIELAKQYIDQFISSNVTMDMDNNVFVMSESNDFDDLTKKCLLVSDTLLITSRSSKYTSLFKDFTKTDHGYYKEYYIWNDNLDALGKWIKKSKDLIMADKVLYYPNIFLSCVECDCLGNKLYGASYEVLSDYTNAIDAIVDSRKVTMINDKNNYSYYLEPVLVLDIPVVNNIGLEDYANITLENLDKLNTFQTYLKMRLLDIEKKTNYNLINCH